MRVLISADMEGTCGVVSWAQVTPPDVAARQGVPAAPSEYEWARRMMVSEVNAAIQGALVAGAKEIYVNEAHDGMRNLYPDDLHPAAFLITGAHKPLSMMQGIDESDIQAVVYTGYHAKAGTPGGVLAHTYTGFVRDLRIGNVSVGEYGLNAAVAGHFGVPVVAISGDDKAVVQARSLLGESLAGVVTKRGLSTTAAVHRHPAKAREAITNAVREGVVRRGEARLYRLEPGTPVEVTVDSPQRADLGMLVPGVRRSGDTALAFAVDDGLELMRLWRLLLNLLMSREPV